MSFTCEAVHSLAHSLERHYFPFEEAKIPSNGIYILFQKGEKGHQGDRIVRVGTHTDVNQLRSRLKQHFMNENKDRSIFRKNIGRAFLNKINDPFLKFWDIDLTTKKAKEKYSSLIDADYQKLIEAQVSEYIQSIFSFCTFEVDWKEDRLKIESKVISIISLCEDCKSSMTWLGRSSPKKKIIKSGLWQVNELYKTPFDNITIADFKKLISKPRIDKMKKDKNKILSKTGKKETSIVRSSAAEYLTFIAASGKGGVEAVYADENIWLTQKMMGVLYDVETHTINYHLKKVFADSELEEDSVIRNFRITAADGKNYNTKHYNLSAVIAVGYKVNSERAVQFRKWATKIIQEFTIKGYTMDDERLKNDGSVLGKQYFEEQLHRIREIRLSERKFYQKITDIYSTSIDYDLRAKATKRFFAAVQNKLHWAIHGQTAAEVIVDRADHKKDNMGLTTWKDAPKGKIQKFDVSVAKNYLTENEMAQLQRLVSAYLDVAEDMALRQIPMTMQDWEKRLNRFIEATDRKILRDAGKVTAEIAKAHAESEFEKYRIIQDRLFESDFDRMIKQLEPKDRDNE